MIKVTLTNEILKYISEIDKNRYSVSSIKLSKSVANKLRKNSKKKSSYASNKVVNQRIRSYELSDFTKSHQKEILKRIKVK